MPQPDSTHFLILLRGLLPYIGVGEYVRYLVNGKNGHGLFTQNTDLRTPRTLEFLKANGYPALVAPEAPAKP